MLLKAAQQRHIDLSRSWMIGDILDDVEAGNRAGCQSVLVDLGTEHLPSTPERWPRFVARSTREALDHIAFVEELRPLRTRPSWYRPPRWSSAASLHG
jgi:D-glycero-D-manno-heptose 1,7-bisphosphate phosphatase